MKSICVFSDTHGNLENIKAILPALNACDRVVFLGDGQADICFLRKEITTELIAVRGNCDHYDHFPESAIFEWEGVRFFVCHGHRFNVKSHLLNLAYEAKANNCSFALFGHTHSFLDEECAGVRLINPGSLSGNFYQSGSYCLILKEKDKFFVKKIPLHPENR